MEDEIDLLQYLPELYRHEVEQFLAAHWTALAAECYYHYLQQGRGLLVLFISKDARKTNYLAWDWLQANWEELFGAVEASTQQPIKELLPCYDPDEECILFLEFPEEDELPAFVIRISDMVIARVSQQPGAAVPKITRSELISPKQAYQALSGLIDVCSSS